MSWDGDWLDWLARRRHPRLIGLVLLGGAVSLVGATLMAVEMGLEAIGFRLTLVGFLAFLLGASGSLAFAVFERGFD